MTTTHQTKTVNKHKFNIFPQAKAEDYNRLRDDIQSNGYDAKQPVVIYQGEILDGWNRWTACAELKITPPTRQFDGTDTEAIALVMRTNKRRNLNSGQWAMIAVEAEDIMAAIAEEVEKERREKQAAELSKTHAGKTEVVCNKTLLQTPPPLKRDPNANSAPTKAAELFNTNRTYVNQAARMKEVAPELAERVKVGTMTLARATKEIKVINDRSQMETAAKSISADKERSLLEVCDVRHCSCAELFASGIKPDAVITDPPYPEKFLPVFSELAEACKDVPLVAVMIGQSYLPEVLRRLCEHLQYRWTLAYLTPGGQAVQQFPAKVNTFWKPVLLFGKAAEWIGDVTRSDVNDNDKDHHHWGQSESGMADLVSRLTKPGQTVCDPFVGGGTTALVSLALNRRFIGCDVDAAAVLETITRAKAAQ